MKLAVILYMIAQASAQYHSLPHFSDTLTALIAQESSMCKYTYNPKDKSAKGCGQIHVNTAYDVTGVHISGWMLEHDPALNIQVAAMILDQCAKANNGDTELALTCYHRGRFWNAGVDTEYVADVQRRM